MLYPDELLARMERVMGIEPTPTAWKAVVLAVILHPHFEFSISHKIITYVVPLVKSYFAGFFECPIFFWIWIRFRTTFLRKKLVPQNCYGKRKFISRSKQQSLLLEEKVAARRADG